VPRSPNKTLGRNLDLALAMNVHHFVREFRKPVRRSSRIWGHAGQMPVRNQNCSARSCRFAPQYQVALSTQQPALRNVTYSPRLEQALQNSVLVEEQKPQCWSQLLRERALAARRQSRDYNELSVHCHCDPNRPALAVTETDFDNTTMALASTWWGRRFRLPTPMFRRQKHVHRYRRRSAPFSRLARNSASGRYTVDQNNQVRLPEIAQGVVAVRFTPDRRSWSHAASTLFRSALAGGKLSA